MQNKLLIFHPGFPKTATTYLQQNLKKNRKINYLLDNREKNNLTKLNLQIFNSKKKPCDKKLLNTLVNLIKSNKSIKKIYLYSYEGIFNPYRYNFKNNFKNFLYIINQLKKDFKIKIFFTLREQNSILKSWYISSYDILVKRFNSMEKFLENELNNKRINKYLDYDLLYKTILKKTKIKPDFLIYEDLVFNKKKYIDDLKKILQINNLQLSKEKINKSSKNKNHYLVIDNIIYFNLLKISQFLFKNFYIIYEKTSIIRKFIKKKFFKEKKVLSFKNKSNFFLEKNKKFSKKIKQLNNNYF